MVLGGLLGHFKQDTVLQHLADVFFAGLGVDVPFEAAPQFHVEGAVPLVAGVLVLLERRHAAAGVADDFGQFHDGSMLLPLQEAVQCVLGDLKRRGVLEERHSGGPVGGDADFFPTAVTMTFDEIFRDGPLKHQKGTALHGPVLTGNEENPADVVFGKRLRRGECGRKQQRCRNAEKTFHNQCLRFGNSVFLMYQYNRKSPNVKDFFVIFLFFICPARWGNASDMMRVSRRNLEGQHSAVPPETGPIFRNFPPRLGEDGKK